MRKKTALLLAFVLLIYAAIFQFNTNFASANTKQKPKLNVSKLELTLGNEFKLRVYNVKKKQKVSFSTSNKKIVSLDDKNPKNVMIQANKVGKATITATITNANDKVVQKLKCNVEVSPNGISIKFLDRLVTLNPEDRFRVEPIIKPNTSKEQPLYESDNEEVATISSRGIITAVAPGITKITATLLSTNQTAVCTVVVTEKDINTR